MCTITIMDTDMDIPTCFFFIERNPRHHSDLAIHVPPDLLVKIGSLSEYYYKHVLKIE